MEDIPDNSNDKHSDIPLDRQSNVEEMELDELNKDLEDEGMNEEEELKDMEE
jgi:hypothetical protein